MRGRPAPGSVHPRTMVVGTTRHQRRATHATDGSPGRRKRTWYELRGRLGRFGVRKSYHVLPRGPQSPNVVRLAYPEVGTTDGDPADDSG